MRIGVYGGTFNPIHRGHLTAARAAADALGLEKVLLIPDNLPPHKALPAGSATGEDRLEMCRLTAGEVPGMEVLDLELRRSGPSYTSDTLAELHAQYPDDELWLLVGSDMFLSLQEWHEPERILSLAGIAAFHRTRGDETAIRSPSSSTPSAGPFRGTSAFFGVPPSGICPAAIS